MKQYKTHKKVIPLNEPSADSAPHPHPPELNPTKAKRYRLISIVVWIIAIAIEGFCIYFFLQNKITFPILLVGIGGILILTLIGSVLWKKANRLDPVSRKNKWRFFVHNQLGLLLSVLAFLPLIIILFRSNNLSGKEKKWAGGIALFALAIAGLVGTDFNPPSIEEYEEATRQVTYLNNGVNQVFWTPSGKSYHLFESCSYINTDRTKEIYAGTIAQAKHDKNIIDLCDLCQRNAVKLTTQKTINQ